MAIRTVASAYPSSGRPCQFIRPLINPMAVGAAEAKHNKIDEKDEERIKAIGRGKL